MYNIFGITKILGRDNIQSVQKLNPYPGGLEEGGSPITCTSGGYGATHCAVSSGVGPITNGCEVTCADGYYACCDDGRTICRCIKK